MSYKIIASDLDGTLLNSSSNLSPENTEAIKALYECGVQFVPASGRSFSEMPEAVKSNPYIRYYIHSSGAAIYDKLEDKRTTWCIPRELAPEIFNIIYKYDCHVTVRMNGGTYTDTALIDKASLDHHNVWQIHRNLLFASGKMLDNFKETVKASSGIEMISLFLHDESDRSRIISELSSLGDLNFAKACPFNLEITSRLADKGNALRTLAAHLSVDISDVMALGDSGNDIPMVKAAGHGVAMSNSMPELLAIADEVICSNDQHGVKYILEKYYVN